MKANFAAALAEAPNHKELPFPEEEYRGRLARVRAAMGAAEVDLLFLTSPEAVYYLTGFSCEWYQAQSGRAFPATSGVAVQVDHDQYIHFETPSEAILTAIGTVSRDVRIFPMEMRRNGLAFILGELEAEGWLCGTAGLELYNYRPNPVIAGQYREGFAGAGMTVVDGTDIVRAVRHVKSPLEMESFAEAARIADIGMAAARDAIGPGVTELEVFGEFVAAMAKAGGEFPGILPPVMSGFRSNCLHPLASRKKIGMGERVNVDLCGVYNRYHCNIARGFWVGEPPAAAVKMHEESIKAFEIIEGMLAPGLNVRAMLEAVRDHYAATGILDEAYWSGGYELGIAFPPDWVGAFIYDLTMTGEGEVFHPMTVVNHECNFYAPDSLGMSATIETLFFHEDRAEFACETPRELQVLFA
jgi:Xaa-Pro aminopeptidase